MTALGDVLAGDADGPPRREDEITLFDSTGLAIQDLAIALAALERADELDLADARALASGAHHLPVQAVRLATSPSSSSSASAAATARRQPGALARSRRRRRAPSATTARTASSRCRAPALVRRCRLDADHREHVRDARDRRRPETQQVVRAVREREVISPGTASTSRPSSSARSAVISAPLRSRASTTTVASASPATIRLRAGKRHGAGSTPGAYSETIRPRSPISAASDACARG